MLQTGDRIDDFEITDVLHSGGLAWLYLAKDHLTDRSVVLKFPHDDILNNPLIYYHFQNEERILSELRHDRIVRLIGRDRSQQYLVLEHIDGKDLRSLLSADRPLSVETACGIAVKTADALSFLHRRGIHHLDVKPENILITPENDIKLIDFGLAWQSGRPDLLRSDFNRPHGSPYYIAPEQLDHIRDDRRADIYSLGLVLYEMLADALPFEKSKKLSKVRQRKKRDPIPPRYFRSNIPPQLQQIVLRCLKRDPDARFPDMPSLIRDIERYTELPVNEEGRLTVKPNRLTSLFSSLSMKPTTSPGQKGAPEGDAPRRGILGAVIDHNAADLVIEDVRRLALIEGGDITLLMVKDPESAAEFTKYQREVEGKRLRQRLEAYVRELRAFHLDPMVRLREGDPAEEIPRIASLTNAGIVVLGPSRQSGLRKFFHGNRLNRAMRKAGCRVLVAQEHPETPNRETLDPEAFDQNLLREVDLKLIDFWIFHVNWLADCVRQMVKKRPVPEGNLPGGCSIERWLAPLGSGNGWQTGVDAICNTHDQLHQVAEVLIARGRAEDMKGVRRVFADSAMPICCKLWDRCRAIGLGLREQTGIVASPLPAFFDRQRCPITDDQKVTGGGIRLLRSIRDYFCEHPDATMEACRLYMEQLPEDKEQIGT